MLAKRVYTDLTHLKDGRCVWEKSIFIPPENINERKKLAEKGLISVVIKFNKNIVEIMDIQVLGIPIEDEISKALTNTLDKSKISGNNIEQQIRERINRFFEQHLGCRPKSVLHII